LAPSEPTERVDANRRFGTSLAIWGDTIVVGAPGEDAGTGAAIVFVRNSGGIWQEHQRLEASDRGGEDDFGQRVAIRGDRMLIGAPGAGTAYVFTRGSDGTWHERTRLVADVVDEGTSGTTFGASVALHDCVAAVGATMTLIEPDRPPGPGVVYAYETCAGDTWPRVARITDPHDALSGDFAWAIALSESHLLVGSPSTREDSTSIVYSYVRTSNAYVLEQEIPSPSTPFSQFGRAIQLRGDTAVVGAPGEGTELMMSRSGAVYVLTRANGAWNVRQRIQPQPGQQPGGPESQGWDHYGREIALDEDRLVVGAPFSGAAGDNLSGSVYVYERAGADFPYRATLIGHESSFGFAVGVSEDDLIVGEVAFFEVIDEDNSGPFHMGTAWAYDATRLDELN
jgi:hypothetical protein